jgi:hypothetical protein
VGWAASEAAGESVQEIGELAALNFCHERLQQQQLIAS